MSGDPSHVKFPLTSRHDRTIQCLIPQVQPYLWSWPLFVQGIAVPEFYVGAMKWLVYSRVLEMDVLIVISPNAAYGYSVIAFSPARAGYALEEKEFFKTSILLITLVLLGRLMAAYARVRVVSAISLHSLSAEKALLIQPSEYTTKIDARLLEFGDFLWVPAHSRIVTDGGVIHGASSLDGSIITGEGIHISKAVRDSIIAGTVNGPSILSIRLTRLPGKNSITDIANLVETLLWPSLASSIWLTKSQDGSSRSLSVSH